MNTAMRVLIFIALAILGYASIFAVFFISLMMLDKLPDDEHLQAFKLSYCGGGVMVSIAATALGLISFFTQGRAQRFFLFLPLLAPLLYSIAVMIFFTR